MISTTDERGVINNFAKDPVTSVAEYPSKAQQRRYWIMGAATTVMMAGVVAIAFAVS
ncbi:MAG: ssl1498 family light-harvesting-like protein [Leptolyngbyaceae cyanobacterium MAG.088]|nr:ssl1498 family light-harvesting-like protein [Leptolyngbyaceae cyanobacterium MAG.088]